jgi:hypothetical protein
VLPNGSHAPASRMLTYLSIAQYRAALAAEAAKDGALHPSVSAAIGAASVVVLSSFFPTAAATFEAQFEADLAGPQWPGAQNRDAGSGEAIGRAVGTSVLALAATDGFNTQSPARRRSARATGSRARRRSPAPSTAPGPGSCPPHPS